MEHFGAVFMLDLMEETTTQLQEEAIASSCLVLAMPMCTGTDNQTQNRENIQKETLKLALH